MLVLILIGLAIVCTGILLWVVIHNQRPKISAQDLQYAQKQIDHLKVNDDISFVIQLHKIWHLALKSTLKDSQITAFEALKKVEDRLPNAEKIWAFHKLRNRLAHEVETSAGKVSHPTLKKTVKKALLALR